MNGKEMEYVGARWCEWKVNGIFGSEMVSGREMEYLGARWREWRGNGICGSKMV